MLFISYRFLSPSHIIVKLIFVNPIYLRLLCILTSLMVLFTHVLISGELSIYRAVKLVLLKLFSKTVNFIHGLILFVHFFFKIFF